jgi:UTP--glucose-1-phosphate uridylyltransferase
MTNPLDAFISKMEKEDLPPLVIDTFSHYYRQLASGETGLLSNDDIQPISPEDLADAADLKTYSDTGRDVMKKTVAIVLNGGLGTSMGLTKAKSLIPVKEGKSFLEIKLKQAEHCGAQLAFMNSYNTHRDTVSTAGMISPHFTPLYFIQNKFPKVLASNLQPVQWPDNPELEWNPPGHGDIYLALYSSGLLKKLLDSGIEYAFIANSDNLGATLDEALLGFFSTHGHSFMMEVAERTPADLKGGHIARYKNGPLVLREIAQCPKSEIAAFQDIRRYRYFNTNNLWVNLKYLKTLFDTNGHLYLPLIVNPKTVNPKNSDSPKVYQIESAMGAAISLFQGSTAVRVSEDRFLPVKKCQDLLAIRSDCYLLTKNNCLILNPKRKSPPPKISLDSAYFSHLDDFNHRIQWPPSLVDCISLNIVGNVFFQQNVIITGQVTITNPGDSPVTIPSGSRIHKDLVVKG